MSIRLNINKIETARLKRGLRKQELAKRAGIKPTRLSQIYADARQGKMPTSYRVREIVEVLGLKLEDVIYEHDDSSKEPEQGSELMHHL